MRDGPSEEEIEQLNEALGSSSEPSATNFDELVAFTVNGYLAVQPIDKAQTKQIDRSMEGMAVNARAVQFIPVTVVFPSEGGVSVSAGDVVYVPGDTASRDYAAKIYKIKGRDFILIPENIVKLVERQG